MKIEENGMKMELNKKVVKRIIIGMMKWKGVVIVIGMIVRYVFFLEGNGCWSMFEYDGKWKKLCFLEWLGVNISLWIFNIVIKILLKELLVMEFCFGVFVGEVWMSWI